MNRRPGTKLIKKFGKHESITAMVEFKGRLYLATSKKVYVKLEDPEQFKEIEIEIVRPKRKEEKRG